MRDFCLTADDYDHLKRSRNDWGFAPLTNLLFHLL